MSAYAADITVIVSSHEHIEHVGRALQEYEAVAGAKFNREKSVGLRLGTWRSKPMRSGSVSVVGHWTEGPVNLLGVWFGPDLQMDNNWDEITCRVKNLAQQWAERKLSLKARAELANAYHASVI